MPKAYYLDAFWVGLGGAAGILGVKTLLQWVSVHWPTAHRATEASFGTNFDATVPGAAVVGWTVSHSLLFTALVALIAAFVAAQLRTRWWLRLLVFLLGGLALIGTSWGSPADFAKQWLAQIILLAVYAFGVRQVMRFNILGCFLVLAAMALVSEAAELLSQPDGFYRLNGYAVIAALVILLAWPLIAWRRAPAASDAASAVQL